MFRYVRTKSGSIWEYNRKLGYYTKPNIATIVEADNESIVARGDEIEELVVVGDLVNNFIIAKHTLGLVDVEELWTKSPSDNNYYKQYEVGKGIL